MRLKNWPVVVGGIVILLSWVGITTFLHFVGGTKSEAAQIGDSFGAVNSLFTGVALGFVAYSIWQVRMQLVQNQELISQNVEQLKQNQQLIQLQREQLQTQNNELTEQNRSWKLVTYINALQNISSSKDWTTQLIANRQISEIAQSLKSEVEKITNTNVAGASPEEINAGQYRAFARMVTNQFRTTLSQKTIQADVFVDLVTTAINILSQLESVEFDHVMNALSAHLENIKSNPTGLVDQTTIQLVTGLLETTIENLDIHYALKYYDVSGSNS